MHQSEYDTSVVTDAPAIGLGLWYDAEKLILEGIYLDEVSAYRARRSWIKTFEMNFLLEEIHDFRVKVVFEEDERRYHVQCTFTSACGRYAFWRLTHHQAPEVQFTLETAHLPHMTTLRFEQPFIEPDMESFASPARIDDVDDGGLSGLRAPVSHVIGGKVRGCLHKLRGLIARWDRSL